jgi:hypothetical protein
MLIHTSWLSMIWAIELSRIMFKEIYHFSIKG